MKILMTGATGLIGKEIGKRLVEKGHLVTVVSRDPGRARQELPFPAAIYKWAGESAPFPVEALEGQEAICHLAGESIADGRWSQARKGRIRDSRVLGTRRLVEALGTLKHPALKAFVSGSAIGIYGDRGDTVLDEASKAGEGFLADVVTGWEREAAQLHGRNQYEKTRIVYVRTGVVFSRAGGALAKMVPLFNAGVGGQLGGGQQWMSWIHIDDIVQLFLFALETKTVEGVLNGTAPEPCRNERLTKELAHHLNRPVSLPIPKGALQVALGEMATTVLESARVKPERALELGFKFKYPDLGGALTELCEPLKSGQHELVSEQWIPRTPDEIFPYFCSEKNLEDLTPRFLNFKVVGKSTLEIGEGTLIDYKMSLHGIPLKWRTRIEEWSPGVRFVDTQLKGPYKKWHHTHEFQELGGGTLMRDRVLFKLPMGWLGDTVAGWKVEQDVHSIFAFRRKKVAELWGH